MTYFIEMKDVTKEYRKGPEVIHALRPTSLQIEQGDFISIQGPSGSGKSTLLHLLGGLDLPSSGNIYYSGKDISTLSDAALSYFRREAVGFIFQSFNLINELTILENVALPLKYSKVEKSLRFQRASETLALVGLSHREKHKPAELSGGEEQRVAIARALINHPDILLADEPTGSLDTHNKKIIMEILNKLNGEGQTLIVVTHDPEITQFASRRLHISDGNLVTEV